MKEIAKIKTPFTQKFGIPRQSLLIEEAWGKIIFTKNDFYLEAFRGIEKFSHLWLIFEFNGVEDKEFSALVCPPRFEGKMKLGVFSTRSPHRPNRLGLSVVKFDRLEINSSEIILWVNGVDLRDDTPIIDIKPYIPYCDSIPNAKAELFSEAPVFKKIKWSCDWSGDQETRSLIEKVVALDPRPAQDIGTDSSYGVSVAGFNVRFSVSSEQFTITETTKE